MIVNEWLTQIDFAFGSVFKNLLTRCELTKPLFPKLNLHISATDPNSPSFESLTAFPLDSAELFVGVYVVYSKC